MRLGRRAITGLAGAAILALGLTAAGAGPAGARARHAAVVPTNVNISRFHGNQSETALAIQRTNPQNITATSNIDTGSGLFHGWSTDGGATWSTDVIANGDPLGSACCDSQMAADEFGNIFLVYIDDASSSVKVALSANGGASFQPQGQLTPNGSVPAAALRGGKLPNGDQPSIAAAEGEVWSSWTSFSSGKIQASGAPVMGLGQVGAFIPAETAVGHATGDYGDTVIGPNGEVGLVYQDPTGGEGPATIYMALDPDGLGPTKLLQSKPLLSTNVGGFDYIPAQAGRSVDAESAFAWDRTGGAHNGRLYLMWTSEQPQESNNMDINVQYSDDMGATWSTSVKVNNDSTPASQFNPRMSLDQTTGNVAVSWYDCRNDSGNHGPGDTNGIKNDDALIYAAVSKNGGVSFGQNFRVGAGVSNSADAANGIDYGDYEGMDFYGGNFYPVWADNSNSTGDNPDGKLHQLDIYTAKIHVA